jgi:hypothetical protein
MIAIENRSKKNGIRFLFFDRSAFFLKKNDPRFFPENRIAIEMPARKCGCRRGARWCTCAQVINFSQSDRDFFVKIAPRFFR